MGKSDGVFDNGQGELSDAAATLDWIERQNLDYSQCWVSGFSFGSLICMQLIMRRPEVNNFIAVSPQPNVYDFSFLAPCPLSKTPSLFPTPLKFTFITEKPFSKKILYIS